MLITCQGALTTLLVTLSLQCAYLVWIYLFGDMHDLIILIMPSIPSNLIQGLSAKFLWLVTVEIIPSLQQLNLAKFEDCFDNEEPSLSVVVAAQKGGTVFSAFLGWEISKFCGTSLGVGEPNGPEEWPRVTDLLPKHEVDLLMAIGYVSEWPQYAFENPINKGKKVNCVALTRDPIKRFISVYSYARDGSESGLWDLSEKLRSIGKVEERLDYLWDTMGEKVMEDTHQMLVDAINKYGCRQVKFDEIMKGGDRFNQGVESILRNIGIKEDALPGLVNATGKHDVSLLSSKDKESNTHVSGRSLERGEKDLIKKLIRQKQRINKVLSLQCLELNYEC